MNGQPIAGGDYERAHAGLLLGGRYRLLMPVGAGGMAVVWKAHDHVLGRTVAVKMLASEQAGDDRARDRIRQEARAAATLSHPNIAQVHDYGEVAAGGRTVPYVVMELVPGGTLARRLAAGPMAPEFALRVGAEVAAALTAAHDEGLVHRDIKPGNVMLADTGAKVVDFGIAAAVAPGGTGLETEVLGTPAYLAPERLVGDAVVPASDVYALGVVLYRMLTGRSPWTSEDTRQMFDAHLYLPPAPLPPLPGISDYVAGLCDRCLAKDPAARPTAREVAAVLARGAGLRVVTDDLLPSRAGAAAGAEPTVLVRSLQRTQRVPAGELRSGAPPAALPVSGAAALPASGAAALPVPGAAALPASDSALPASDAAGERGVGEAPGLGVHADLGGEPVAALAPSSPGEPVADPPSPAPGRPVRAGSVRRWLAGAGVLLAAGLGGWLLVTDPDQQDPISAAPAEGVGPADSSGPVLSRGPAQASAEPSGRVAPADPGLPAQVIDTPGRVSGSTGAAASSAPASGSATPGPATTGPAATEPTATGTAAPSRSVTTTPAGTAPATTAPRLVRRTLTSDGGVVDATCSAPGTAEILAWTATKPYKVESADPGPASRTAVTYKRGSSRLTMTVTCESGVPSAATTRS
ncbi:serine/threonine-protein kinase [Actinoplanes sp. DH11]|uniref:serine/threonine-protein kinase n=1 Tax=Actinoplanes sp. DH11 TaxID=2857011 RepID=UPI001E3DC0A6|nr:serine/threonine-protein kinase [Actinoplanes sp. DH11]